MYSSKIPPVPTPTYTKKQKSDFESLRVTENMFRKLMGVQQDQEKMLVQESSSNIKAQTTSFCYVHCGSVFSPTLRAVLQMHERVLPQKTMYLVRNCSQNVPRISNPYFKYMNIHYNLESSVYLTKCPQQKSKL